MCDYNNYNCSYCPAGMAETMTCPKHRKVIETLSTKVDEDSEDLEDKQPTT